MPDSRTLSEHDRSLRIDREDGFTFRTAETPRARRPETFRTHRAREHFRKNAAGDGRAVFKKGDRAFDRIFNIEKLGKSEKLKHFGHFRLNIEQDDIAASRLYHFQKCGKRTDTG